MVTLGITATTCGVQKPQVMLNSLQRLGWVDKLFLVTGSPGTSLSGPDSRLDATHLSSYAFGNDITDDITALQGDSHTSAKTMMARDISSQGHPSTR